MNRRALLLLLNLCWVASVRAHRLDEYLQATFISVETNRVVLDLSLTPGVSVAADILARIDTNGDGGLSVPEGEAYAQLLLGELAVKLDAKRLPLEVTATQFPPVADMLEGMGTIHVELSSQALKLAVGQHQVVFENHHRPDVSAYLVNAVLPASKAVHVSRQLRDGLQARIQLDVMVETPPQDPPAIAAALDRSPRWPWLLAGTFGPGIIALSSWLLRRNPAALDIS